MSDNDTVVSDRHKNLLGLRNPYTENTNTLRNNEDVKAVLELSNLLRFSAGLQVQEEYTFSTLYKNLDKSLKDFNYLNEPEDRSLTQAIAETLSLAGDENNIKRLPAHNAMLVVFRLLDVLDIAITNPMAYLDGQTQNQLAILQNNLLKAIKDGFAEDGSTINEFLDRFNAHKLWQNNLSNKDYIFKKLYDIK